MSSQPTGVSINAKQMILFLLTTLMPLIIEVDGVQSKGKWGEQFVNLSPGSHQVAVFWKLYFVLPIQRGQMNVTVNPGQTVSLRYKCRMFILLPGKLTVDTAPVAAAA